jgi:glycosyltransferase involved in cell wall biosynthesis
VRQTFDTVPCDVSAVVRLYNEEEALPAFYRELTETFDRLLQSAQIIFADDRSTDGLAGRLDAIAKVQVRIYFEERERPPHKIRQQHSSLPRRRAAPNQW